MEGSADFGGHLDERTEQKMTAIIAVRRADGGISMGADRRVSVGRGQSYGMVEPKIFNLGPYLVGASGSCSAGQIIQEWQAGGRRMPARPKGMDHRTYLRTKLAPVFRHVLEQEGQIDEEWALLITVAGRIFVMDNAGLGVDEVAFPYLGIGCGRYLAMGAMHAMLFSFNATKEGSDFDKHIAARFIARALDAAAAHDTRCGDGFDIMHGDAP
jgi:20S proteasome alpha/beta subunit